VRLRRPGRQLGRQHGSSFSTAYIVVDLVVLCVIISFQDVKSPGFETQTMKDRSMNCPCMSSNDSDTPWLPWIEKDSRAEEAPQ